MHNYINIGFNYTINDNDKIVCINNDRAKELKIGKIYIAVIGSEMSYSSTRFIQISEYRKQKLKKICSK